MLGLILGGLVFGSAGIAVGWFGCRWMDRHYPIGGGDA